MTLRDIIQDAKDLGWKIEDRKHANWPAETGLGEYTIFRFDDEDISLVSPAYNTCQEAQADRARLGIENAPVTKITGPYFVKHVGKWTWNKNSQVNKNDLEKISSGRTREISDEEKNTFTEADFYFCTITRRRTGESYAIITHKEYWDNEGFLDDGSPACQYLLKFLVPEELMESSECFFESRVLNTEKEIKEALTDKGFEYNPEIGKPWEADFSE
ncbi:hypothetical protein HOK51_08360 [Candidatus Woesearchaeota archaeon]|jgi:hypothetical protein|nr:hypothetical protein [Candidatus Woesearchaeota archaeon]MBT6519838.1 hypothetical protein [Candidatus Woesearchaeota archaeon]MBT7366889.1 hypothetical protein [Candidatus Woesearchaeota archaeon]